MVDGGCKREDRRIKGRETRYRPFERLRTFFVVAIAENREDCARTQAGLNCYIEYR